MMEASTARAEGELIHAFAAPQARAPLTAHRCSLGPLLPTKIELTIKDRGVCHSDVHLIDDDWGVSTFPLAPGHEIAGTDVRAAMMRRVCASAAGSVSDGLPARACDASNAPRATR